MVRRHTRNEFVEAARKVHGNRYDYSKVEYTGTDNNVIIICKTHGEFLQTPYSHTRRANCGKCMGRGLTVEEWVERLKNVHGDAYDYSKIEDVSPGKKFPIVCPTHGEWHQDRHRHLSGIGCHKCIKIQNAMQMSKPKKGDSLGDKFPHLVGLWDNQRNGEVTIFDVYPSSTKKFYWKCSTKECHIHDSPPADKIRSKSSCPICSKYSDRICQCGCNSLEKMYPHLAREWHPDNNKKPSDFRPGSNTKVKWVCENGHQWEAIIASRTLASHDCIYCTNQAVSIDNNLETIFPEIASQWHPTRNEDLTPRDIVAKSSRKVWWKCNQGDDHEWEISPNRRTPPKETGCPFCAGRMISSTNRLDLVRTDVSADWNYDRNKKSPSEYHIGSNDSVWWKCVSCNHEWNTTISNRTDKNSGCRSCLGMVVHSEGGNSAADLSPLIAKEWHPEKNDKSPFDYRPSAAIHMYWTCSKCSHVWKAALNHRLDGDGKAKSGCPSCAPTGFDPGSEAYYYCMVISGPEGIWWYKGGIAADVEIRMRNIKASFKRNNLNLETEILEKIWYEDGWVAQELESKLLKVESIRESTLEKFDGASELFSQNPVEYARINGWLDE